MKEHGQGIVIVDERTVDTNLVFVKVLQNVITKEALIERLERKGKALDDQASVLVVEMGEDTVRISFHLDVTAAMTEAVCKKLRYVMREIRARQ